MASERSGALVLHSTAWLWVIRLRRFFMRMIRGTEQGAREAVEKLSSEGALGMCLLLKGNIFGVLRSPPRNAMLR